MQWSALPSEYRQREVTDGTFHMRLADIQFPCVCYTAGVHKNPCKKLPYKRGISLHF